MTSPSQSVAPCFCGKTDCDIPYGLCHCRCGRATDMYSSDRSHNGQRKGTPRLFIHGHHGRIRPEMEDAYPFKIDGVYCRLMPLTQGFHAIVDATDYFWLMAVKWCSPPIRSRKTRYAVRGIIDPSGKQTTISMHRTILNMGEEKKPQRDHRNGNGLDNRRKNLRYADNSENQQNKGKQCNNTSGYKGVSFHPASGKWRAIIKINRKTYSVGYYDTKEEAFAARCAAIERFHGEFARVA
jgi:hypothetical protein